jgi:nucleoside-diphosphate-sugar epimerase
VAEDDPVHGEYLYARHKIMNEWQARDYIEEYGMQVTGIRAAYVTGSDKVRGTLDHVKIITEPALGNAVTIPYEDAMCCAIHVDAMAEVFARVVLKDKPAHCIYNSGGTAISHGEIAAIVRSCIPDARILFQSRTGAKAVNATYLLDNSRLRTEFAIEFPPFRERVQQIINEVRQKHGLSAVG